MTKKSSRYLRRYTDIPALIYLLTERKITLLDPDSWDDSNDIRYLRLYCEKKELASVLALCFTQATETYHHWRVFANGSSGVCIWFKRAELLKAIHKVKADVRTDTVAYLTSDQIKKKRLTIQELPFLKRSPFEDEKEFRIICESKMTKRSAFDIEIPLSCIAKIKLSPWIHYALFKRMKKLIGSFLSANSENRLSIAIQRSTIIGNMEWKQLGESAV